MKSRDARISLATILVAFVVGAALFISNTPAAKTTSSASTVTQVLPTTVTDLVISNATVTVTENRPYAIVINPDAMVGGSAVSIPSCAVHAGCTTEAGQSSLAMLILYDGAYYYVSNYTVTSQSTTVYTVWYTNSTDYCVSPAFPDTQACPDAVFVSATPAESGSASSSSTSQSVTCTISGTGGPLFVRIVTDGGVPVSDQEVDALQDSPCGSAPDPIAFTNSSGWAQILGAAGLPYAGSFRVSLTYSGGSYNATVTIGPLEMAYLTFSVPSGRTSLVTCYITCQADSGSMTMGS